MAYRIIDLEEEAFKAYSAQRWLWNEPAQLQLCLSVSKLPEGNFNKAFLATMRDRNQVVIKIPNLNAGPAHYTTASEVATMQYVRDRLRIPVPKVLAFCSKASDSDLGAEYIVMQKAPGIELGQKWDGLKAREKLSIVKQVAAITSTLAQSLFPCHGALYKRQDLTASESIIVDDEFVIGPTIGRAWFDDRRGDVDVPRGPWSSALDVMQALVQREEACLEKFPTFHRDCQQGLFGGPGGYRPTKEAKLSVLQDFLKIYSHIMPKTEELCAGVIWHNDLHTDNIFVDTENPSQITCIIDWQGAPVYPMFLITHHPSLIEYEGPKLGGFVEPSLPDNLKSLDPEAKNAAKKLFLSQSLWLSYEIEVQRALPELLHSFRYTETLPGQILGMVGSIYDDGEPYVQSLLSDVSEEAIWKQVVGAGENDDASVPCPLIYSEQERSRQKEEYAKWERDVERKTRVLNELGVYPGWNGAVSPQDYGEVVRRLSAAKESFLTRESANEQERALWKEV
ncbi:kinase-like domain-containing protein [Aspergillus carlsbadensis]|nr:kinase-like domain-containing protein [Aspergillus carlsbadensis]